MPVRARHAGRDPASRGRGVGGLDAGLRRNDGRLHSIVGWLHSIVMCASQDDERPAVEERPAGPGWVAPLLHIRNHKVLTILLPLQGDGPAHVREVLDHTLPLHIPEKLRAQRRHPHRGPA